jgi:cytochrome bd-type quinol oxidase subunit 2
MQKYIKRIMLTVASLAAMFAPAMIPAAVYAQDDTINSGVCQGTKLEFTADPPSNDCQDAGDATTRINEIVRQIINIFSVIVGIVSVIMIVYGGFRYITSGGDAGKVGSAKNTILYAVIGLVIVALAQVLVKFVFAKAQDSA